MDIFVQCAVHRILRSRYIHILKAFILSLSLSFSVQVSEPYVAMGKIREFATHNLVFRVIAVAFHIFVSLVVTFPCVSLRFLAIAILRLILSSQPLIFVITEPR